MKTIISISEKQTLELAKKLSSKAKTPLCICLYGDLGAGKTTFSKGFATGFGIPAKQIKSPTYTLIRKYVVGRKLLYHCDFYRINEPDDLLSADLEEIFAQKNAVVLIEWPERVAKLLPKNRIEIHIKTPYSREKKDENTRKLIITHYPR